jgi:SAM-dependent MidA family methyltransferase
MPLLSRIIADEIRQNGPISMGRFMQLALYCPVYGYYERRADTVGRQGDFQTSVTVGPMFGELLAARFAGWLDALKRHGAARVHVVEAGGHTGQLAMDILGWMARARPELYDSLDYHLLEPSEARRSWQAATAKAHGHRIRWSSGFDSLHRAIGGVHGVIFSNEMLDALPTDRFLWDESQQVWVTGLVAERDGQFRWIRGREANAAARAVLKQMAPAEVCGMLPDGYAVDYSAEAIQWWLDAAANLNRGRLLTLDYGYGSAGAVVPERTEGTLRGYRRHQLADDVLSDPGRQDITAHVHFDELRKTGEGAGMRTEFLGSQERFLVRAMEELTGVGHACGTLGADRLRQFKTLIHPDHFGHAFQVLLQARP